MKWKKSAHTWCGVLGSETRRIRNEFGRPLFNLPSGRASQQIFQPRFALLVLYYFAIIAVLFVLYGRSGFSTPPFLYQGF